MSVYTIIGALYFEEPDLLEELGEDYLEYTNKVPAFFPFKSVKMCYCAKKEKIKD